MAYPRSSGRIHNALPNALFIDNNPYAKRYNTSRYHLVPAPLFATATAPILAPVPAPIDDIDSEMSTVDYSDMPPLKYLETPPRHQQQQPEDDPMDIDEEEEMVEQSAAAPNPRPYKVTIFLDSSSEESDDERTTRSKAKARRMKSTRTIIDLADIDD